MSDEIDQKTKVGQNTWFFSPPSSLRPLEAEIAAFKSLLVGGWWCGVGTFDYSVSPGPSF